jgi:hypothetical protein
MIETEIYLINFENLQRCLGNNLRNTREGFVFWKGRKVFTRFAWSLLKETKEAKLGRAFYKPEG